MQISAGEAAPIFWNQGVSGLTVTVHLMRMTDDFYWDGTTWNASPASLGTIEFYNGVYRFVCPDNVLNGYYMLAFNDGVGGRHIEQLYAGAHKFVETLNTCLVYGLMKNLQGEPIPDAKVYVTPVDVPLTGNTAISKSNVFVYTDESGLFEISLVRGSEVYIAIDEAGYRKRVIIPDSVSVKIEDLEVV